MADGLCTGDAVSTVIEKTLVKDYGTVIECVNTDRVNDVTCKNVKSFYITSDSDKLFDKLCSVKGSNAKHEGFLDMEMPRSPGEDDCRKKRCADRYDSSESSDSGVAVLSCTDCSGSSTASSDITDPGSPFSTASSHSEDSASQPAKMPPTQTAHHPPWPWAAGESPSIKRPTPEKTVSPKRLKIEEDKEGKTKTEEDNKKPPACLSSSLSNLNTSQISNLSIVNKSVPTQVLPITKDSNSNKTPSPNSFPSDKLVKSNKITKKTEIVVATKSQQGKITEYFRSQMKSNGIKKELSNLAIKTNDSRNPNLHKYFSLVDGSKQINSNIKTQNNLRKIDIRTLNPQLKKVANDMKTRKLSQVTIPRKILPAPSKTCDKITVNNINSVNNVSNFSPTVTLTALAIQPNLTYLHTKAPKPPDNYFVQQFTTISNDKINAIPIVNTSPCINTVIPPLQRITTNYNFNCIKLNATVVPIVKLNTLPSKVNGSCFNNVALNVEAGAPTVPNIKPKLNECNFQKPVISVTNLTPKEICPPSNTDAETVESKCRSQEQHSPPDSDSGVSSRDPLEVSISHTVTVEPQKSPILSQPKTIRFPAKQDTSECKESGSSHSSDSTQCRWAECQAQFDTSGALLEHLQIKHVISQATQEQYVCLWLGCKVHGRTSCSRSWLERHVLAHAGTKPFRCIVEGCGMRFNSQLTLERHVNGHFNTDNSQNGSAKKSVENGSIKLFKRNGKKLRFRRQPWSARMFDFFDGGIMEGLQHQLLTMTDKRTNGQIEGVPGDTVTVHSRVLANRIEADGKKKFLLRWNPPDIVPDEWVTESEFSTAKTVSIRTLEPSAINALKPMLFPNDSCQPVRQKQRRKPSKPI